MTVSGALGAEPLRLAQLRERAENSGWSDRPRIDYAGALLSAGRVAAAASVLGVRAPAGAFLRFPEAASPVDRFDPRRRCVKCGEGRALVRYVPDRLERTCRRCGWSWAEAPLVVEDES